MSTPVAIARAERVLDACDEHGLPLPLSCRTASCGVCLVHVLEGADLVEPPGPEELEVLDLFEAHDQRLACQLVIQADQGTLRLSVTRRDP